MKKIILLILIGIFYNCRSKKVVTEFKEVVKRDSIYIIKDRYITKSINDTIVIDKACDSLGNLKSFDRVIKTNNLKISLKSVKGTIQATVNVDSIVNSKIQEFKQNYQTKTEIKEVEIVRYRTPFWMWCVIVAQSLFIILFIKSKYL